MEDAFERTARHLERWDDPHPPPDRIVAEEEYSRLTNPARWRIIGARVDAWTEALVTNRLATVDRDVAVRWHEPPPAAVTRTDLVTPGVPHGMPLVVGRSRIGDVDDAGVTLGVGDPAVFVHAMPDCGCDACDSGSADAIEEVDTWLGGIVDGAFRHLRSPLGTITVRAAGLRAASYGPRRRFDVDAVLADASGWREWSGPAWLG